MIYCTWVPPIEIGDIKHASADLLLNQSMFPEDDIHYDFELGGGAMMDPGCTYS